LLDVTDTVALPNAPAQVARQLGLRKVGGRPPLGNYAKQIWQRRHFAFSLARGRAYSRNQGGYLGQLWIVLTPVLWAVLYFAIFGLLLDVSKGIANFATYLVCGLFLFRFIASAMNKSANSIEQNTNLITSLQFPRALIPLSYATAELLQLIPALVILLGVALVDGEPLRLHILLLVPAVVLAYLFACGLAMISARLVAEINDLGNLIPFVNRALMYTSGVFFSVERYGEGTLGTIMTHQPFAVFLHLGRSSLMESVAVSPRLWLWAIGGAVGVFAIGLVFFWRAEAKYGRG
jgi:teichoic acid transport system permease protein